MTILPAAPLYRHFHLSEGESESPCRAAEAQGAGCRFESCQACLGRFRRIGMRGNG